MTSAMYGKETLMTIFIILVTVGAIVLLGVFLSMTLPFRKTGSKKYNPVKYLPFELNPFKRYLKSSYIYTGLEILGTVLIGSGLISYLLIYSDRVVFYFIVILLMISLISFNFLMFIKMSNVKLHLAFAIITAFSTLLTSFLEFLFLSNNNTIIYGSTKLNIVLICINIILMLFFLFNPTYKTWYKMTRFDNQTVARPKYNYLAILEWGSFVVTLLNIIPLIVSLF